MKEFSAFAHQLADAAGDVIRRYYRQPIPVDLKLDNSPVTKADQEAEKAMHRLIHKHFPNHGIIGEEYGVQNEGAEYIWVLDPIDGTASFIAGRPIFVTLIALCTQTPPSRGGVETAKAVSGAGAKPYPQSHTAIAKDLRALSTEAEKILWQKLRAKQFHGFKFRRQQPIGAYIVDFACMEKKIIIELDGGQHALQPQEDEQRTDFIKKEGFSVIRFWNNEIIENLEGVWESLERQLLRHPPPKPRRGFDPSPQGRGFLTPILGIIDQPITKERWVGDGNTATLNGKPIQVRECSRLEDAVLATTGPQYFTAEGKVFFDSVSTKVRRTVYGGDGYNYALLASGHIDAVIEQGLKLHDVMALIPIIEGAGGKVTDWNGAPVSSKHNAFSILAASKDLPLQILS